jgi:hypothetical protein
VTILSNWLLCTWENLIHPRQISMQGEYKFVLIFSCSHPITFHAAMIFMNHKILQRTHDLLDNLKELLLNIIILLLHIKILSILMFSITQQLFSHLDVCYYTTTMLIHHAAIPIFPHFSKFHADTLSHLSFKDD